MPQLVFVCGNTGSGKSTLTELLAKELSAVPYVSVAEKNPYLTDFHADGRAWGFHVQLHYLVRHLRDSLSIAVETRTIVRDRSFYEGAEVYARELLETNCMTDRDYSLYRSLYETFLPMLPRPTVVIYLRSTPQLLLRRIALRARRNEQPYMTEDRLIRLNALYEAWIRTLTVCPVVTVDNDDYEFVKNGNDLSTIVQMVTRVLGSPAT